MPIGCGYPSQKSIAIVPNRELARLVSQKNAASRFRGNTPRHNGISSPFSSSGNKINPACVPIRVDGCKVSPLLRQVLQSKDRGHRTNRHASATINTFHWTNVKLRLRFKGRFIFPRVNAIDRANIHAGGKFFGSYTGLSDYVRHRDSPSRGIEVSDHYRICRECKSKKNRFIYHQTTQPYKTHSLHKKYSTSGLGHVIREVKWDEGFLDVLTPRNCGRGYLKTAVPCSLPPRR